MSPLTPEERDARLEKLFPAAYGKNPHENYKKRREQKRAEKATARAEFKAAQDAVGTFPPAVELAPEPRSKREFPKKDPGRMTLDEINEEIERFARSGEGPDKFRALKMLASMNSAGISIPEPMSYEEAVGRMSAVMKGGGIEMVHLAYRKAFKMSNSHRWKTVQLGRTKPGDLDPDLPMTLKDLYARFPDLKKHGTPVGYPQNVGAKKAAIWVQAKCRELEARSPREILSEAHELHEELISEAEPKEVDA